MRNIGDVIAEQAVTLMSLSGVVGLAESESEGVPCILIMLEGPLLPETVIPEMIEGHPVVFMESGEIWAMRDGKQVRV